VSTESTTLSVPVFNRDGAEVGKIDVNPAEFGGKINRQLLHDVVVMYLANQRAGTHSTLRRGEVAGSTKKLFRQKGTGNARAGTKRTNKRRGGGTAKGPKPRDYEYHLPRKAVRAATRMAILSKLADNEALVVDDLSLTEVKTKPVAQVFKALGKALGDKNYPTATVEEIIVQEGKNRTYALVRYEDGRTGKIRAKEGMKAGDKVTFKRHITYLVGTAGYDKTLYMSARNIDGVKVLPASEFNAYAVLRQKRLVLTRAALEELRKGPPKGATVEKPEHAHPRRKLRGAEAKAAAAAQRKPQQAQAKKK
jgi:large subunit ribosomal protein L4